MRIFFLLGALLISHTAFAADNCSRYGCPSGAASNNDLINRAIYTMSNNRTTKFADWVAYKVTPNSIDGPSRSRSWKSDPNIASAYTLEASDYKDAHAILQTDRGHQVPLASFSNTSSWSQTNYLSNITPQSSNLNQGPWVRLETAVRNLARSGKQVYVVTGPLYEYYFSTLPQADENHRIPSGYFKVVATISHSGYVKASGFIMEQNSGRNDYYCNKEVTIDQVESRTGLNILPGMSNSKAYAVESKLGGISADIGC
ncbi:DNA/RNA non-specific endonuclease [Shewanella sp. WPAGA9]|uniref:DNA/RNA non-specific endonuclease n=1 Tax=Shewanella sp. ENK2 TaxID=2775245 RepID=UPI001780AE6D|nr:DNA/RNA non-specific endonuclease [Shewanella sp. WPAGA9]